MTDLHRKMNSMEVAMKPKLQYKRLPTTWLSLDGEQPPALTGGAAADQGAEGSPIGRVLSQPELKRIVKRIRERERKALPLRVASFDC